MDYEFNFADFYALRELLHREFTEPESDLGETVLKIFDEKGYLFSYVEKKDGYEFHLKRVFGTEAYELVTFTFDEKLKGLLGTVDNDSDKTIVKGLINVLADKYYGDEIIKGSDLSFKRYFLE